MKNTSAIQYTVEKENEEFFLPRCIKLELLKNCPEAIPSLVQWMYDEWHSYDASLTKEKLTQSFLKRLKEDKIPLTLVVLKKDVPIGTISLKERPHDFLDLPPDSLWIGNLQVVPEEQNHGLGQELLKCACAIAKSFGYQKIYFYTSNFEKVDWYLKRGSKIFEKRMFRNHPITIMHMDLTSDNPP